MLRWINNISISGWVIRDSIGIIKMTESRHLGNVSILTAECVALRDGVLAAIYKQWLHTQSTLTYLRS